MTELSASSCRRPRVRSFRVTAQTDHRDVVELGEDPPVDVVALHAPPPVRAPCRRGRRGGCGAGRVISRPGRRRLPTRPMTYAASPAAPQRRPPDRAVDGLPRLPAARHLAGEGRRGQARGVRRGSVLGTPGRRVRRGPAALARARPRAGRAWRQPHRTRLHRRPQRRLAVRRDAPRRARQPADERHGR